MAATSALLSEAPPKYGTDVSIPTSHAGGGTVAVTFDDVVMHLPPPALDCFRACEYPEFVAAVGLRASEHCALSIACTTVKPWFRKSYKKVVSVEVVRDADHEARQDALMTMEFQVIRALAKACQKFVHTENWYEKMLDRYNKAVAEFKRKYGCL